MNTREEIREWCIKLGFNPCRVDGFYSWEHDNGDYRDLYHKNGLYIDRLFISGDYDRLDIETDVNQFSTNKIFCMGKPITFEFFKSVLDYIEN